MCVSWKCICTLCTHSCTRVHVRAWTVSDRNGAVYSISFFQARMRTNPARVRVGGRAGRCLCVHARMCGNAFLSTGDSRSIVSWVNFETSAHPASKCIGAWTHEHSSKRSVQCRTKFLQASCPDAEYSQSHLFVYRSDLECSASGQDACRKFVLHCTLIGAQVYTHKERHASSVKA